jgi:plastocyanin
MKKTYSIAAVLVSLGLATTAGAATHDIVQNDKKFDKTEITVKAGDTINFKNSEKDITHNVFSLGPTNAFELKTQAPGSASAVKFDKPGVTEVECAIHTNMKLKVTVQ